MLTIKRPFIILHFISNELAVISGIGCSGRISGYINSYGVHS
ncbi:2-oxoacid:ferredoxin oxidoreductase subunit beta, partial [Bacillus thuringiensis]|nr:2-oxoacid:ferredoxin oxidoreductase subunit beta [Bacillus thuringiensis]